MGKDGTLLPRLDFCSKFSTDPELGARHRRPVLASTDNEIVLCVDEEVADSGPGPDRADAVDADRLARAAHPRLHPTRHLHPGGGTSLDGVLGGVAALDIATGRVTGLRKPRHRHREFLLFLKHPARAYPERELHLVMDNYATHKKAEVWAWLAENPRIMCISRPPRHRG